MPDVHQAAPGGEVPTALTVDAPLANAPLAEGSAPEKAYSTDEENYSSDSIWDAMDHLDCCDALEAGRVVYEGDVVKRKASHFAPDMEWFTDQMADAAYEEGGEFAETWPCNSISSGKLGELEELIAGWLDANVPVTFFTITNPRAITITEEMIAEFRGPAASGAEADSAPGTHCEPSQNEARPNEQGEGA